MPYSGERALVVGGTGGIGRALAEELLDGGSEVALTYHVNRQEAERLAERAAGLGRRCFLYPLDLRQAADVLDTCERVTEELGVPTIVALCAGVLRDRPLASMEVEDWDEVIDVNLGGSFRVLRAVVPTMMRKGGGRIVCVTSVSAFHGQPGQSSYAAAKGGLVSLVRALARELGPFRITVNAIAPGLVETDMTAGVADVVRRRYLERIPLRRFATPADVVPVARLLMNRDGAYVTGQVLVVDGGLTC